MNVGVVPAFMSVYPICEGPCSQKRASDPSGLESEEDYEPQCGYWDLNLGPPEEWPVVLVFHLYFNK